MKLDSYQQAAAYQNEPYSAIIAGAGTGKTYTLLGRISYLVSVGGLDPQEIVVISYTNETVREFEEKILKQLGFSVRVFTFHKLAIFLLDENYIPYEFCENDLLDFIFDEFIYGYAPYITSIQKCFLEIVYPFYNYFIKNFFNCLNSTEIENLKKEVIQFIRLFYAKGFSKKWLISLISRSFGKKKAFYIVVFCIFQLYQSELESQMLVDFDSLISLAIQSISGFSNCPFRHILVDEFQDSSKVRIDFLTELINRFQLQFTVVGDDCQSIYRFSGTEANCFSLLKERFSKIHFFYLKYTYRNSQELISMANHFVLKNKMQLKKDIYSMNHVDFPIELFFYRSPRSIFSMLHAMHFSVNDEILFLGRNSFDWKYYFNENDIVWKNKKHFSLKKFPNINFSFLTVHQAKGLEADVVILLHMENSKYGFPNQIKSSNYFSCFKPESHIIFDEERRLFYVALTRTRNKVYCLAPVRNPSVFIKELRKDFKGNVKITFF